MNKYLYNGKELQTDFDLGWYDYGARYFNSNLGGFINIDPRSEEYSNWSLYNYVGNNPIKRVDVNGEGWGEDLVNGLKNYAKDYVRKTTKNIISNTAKSIRESFNYLVENTKVVLSGDFNLTEELGAEFEIKGVGGFGGSATLTKYGYTSTTSVNLKDGEFNNEDSRSLDPNNTYTVKGQVAGNGAFIKVTEGKDGYSTEGGITTTTEIPGVQTETSVTVKNNKVDQVATGVAIGVKTPIAPTTTGTLMHASFDISLKFVFKNPDEE